MPNEAAVQAANEEARAAIAEQADTTTLSGIMFSIFPPGAVEMADYIGEFPAMAVIFGDESGLKKVAAGGKAFVEFARIACREGAEIEEFDKIARRASFREMTALIRKVVAMWAGKEGLGPFVREELGPMLTAVGGAKRASQIESVVDAIEKAIDKGLDSAFAQAARSIPQIQIKPSGDA